MYEWALKKVKFLNPEVKPKSSDDLEDGKGSEKSLFCEDTVYHASLCCNALETKNVTTFFGECKHQFEELSISRSDRENVDRYLISRKGKTYFIAFLGESVYSEWPKKYTSFEHG